MNRVRMNDIVYVRVSDYLAGKMRIPEGSVIKAKFRSASTLADPQYQWVHVWFYPAGKEYPKGLNACIQSKNILHTEMIQWRGTPYAFLCHQEY